MLKSKTKLKPACNKNIFVFRMHSYLYGIEMFFTTKFPELISQIECSVKKFLKVLKNNVRHVTNGLGFRSVSRVKYVCNKNDGAFKK